MFARLEGQPIGKVRRVYADAKYHNFALYKWVEANAGWELFIVRRPDGDGGWVKTAIPVDGGGGRLHGWADAAV